VLSARGQSESTVGGEMRRRERERATSPHNIMPELRKRSRKHFIMMGASLNCEASANWAKTGISDVCPLWIAHLQQMSVGGAGDYPRRTAPGELPRSFPPVISSRKSPMGQVKRREGVAG